MAENLTKIGSSYDMVDIMQKIGSNYFDNDLSTQRIGMFGFTVEGLANMFGAAILDASNRQREYNVYTANKRSTLLYEGSRLGITINNAYPAKMTAYLGILTSSLVNTHSKGGFGIADPKSIDPNHPDYKLVIEKDMIINIADYNFMVEHDILIKATYNKNNNAYTFSVQYLLEGDKDTTSYNGTKDYIVPRYNTAYPTNDKYIQSYLHTYAKGLSMLLFKVDLVQISKETKYQSIIKNDIVSLTGMDFFYSNNLSHFNVFYRKNNTSDWENIMTVPVYMSDETYEEDVIFYEVFHDEKKIRLNMTDFTPAYNSEIRVDIYNTIGTEVNDIEYSGDGSDISITLNTMEERHSYTGLELNCKPISKCAGASDVPTLEELRTRVIRARATANSIDTDYDLLNYMESKDDSNDYVFIKKRNDIIERRYSCFMIPRLKGGDIIPSSTLDLSIVNFREKVDMNISHYKFEEADKLDVSETNAPMYYKDGFSFVGSKSEYNHPNEADNDQGVNVYNINRILNNIDSNTNLNEIYVPLNGIYTSNDFKDSFTNFNPSDLYPNPTGLTKSGAYISLFDLITKDPIDEQDPNHLGYSKLINYLEKDNDGEYTGRLVASSENVWKNLTIPNNIELNSKFMMFPATNENVVNSYFYDINSRTYKICNAKEGTNILNTSPGALKHILYLSTPEVLEGIYINSQTNIGCYLDPFKNKRKYAFIEKTDGTGQYRAYTTENGEFVFAKVRNMSEDGNIEELPYIPYEMSETGDTRWSRTFANNVYFDMIELTNESDVMYIIDGTNDGSNLVALKYSDSVSKLVSINDTISFVMVDDTVMFESSTTSYQYFRSPYHVMISEDSPNIDLTMYDKTMHFEITSYKIEAVDNDIAFDVNGVLIKPEVYYGDDGVNISSYDSNLRYYYKLDKDIVNQYSEGLFFPINTDDYYLKRYLLTEYQYYNCSLTNSTNYDNEFIYMYYNPDNVNKEFIRYNQSLTINDLIVYSIGEKINTYKKSYNLGYFVHIDDNRYSSLFKVTDIYFKIKTKDIVDLGEYIYNLTTRTYVKDISSTDVKGIKYTTNNAGDKVSITIKAGTPFALARDIIKNSDDHDKFSIITDPTNNDHVCDPECNCNNTVNGKVYSYYDKYNKNIFDNILGDKDKNISPKVYYQYPIQGIENYYSEDFGFSKDSSIFYRNNSLLPINRWEKINVSEFGETDKYKIDPDKGIYLSDTNESLEDYIKVYTSPYTISYDIEKQIASFFLTGINKSVNMNLLEESSKTPANFSIESIHIYRNPMVDFENEISSYKITLDLLSNGDISNATFNKDSNTYINKGCMKNSIMVKGFIYDSAKMLRGWFDFEPDETVDTGLNVFRFNGTIDITDDLSETYCTTMTNFYDINGLNTMIDSDNDTAFKYNGKNCIYASNPRPENFLNLSISDLTIGIGCYIVERSRDLNDYIDIVNGDPKPAIEPDRNNTTSSKCITESISNDSSFYPMFVNKTKYTKEVDNDGVKTYEDEIVIEKYILTNVYTNSLDSLSIYTDMSDYVKSSVVLNGIDRIWNHETEKFEDVSRYEVLHFTDIPVVRYSQCLNGDVFARISDNIVNAHENLSDLSYNITNNYSIDFKFFRTYGPCRYFKLCRPDQDLKNVTSGLQDLDINIVFSLLIKSNLSISDAEVVAQLKTYIKERIESLNINESEDSNDYTIYISNIITDIENKFNDYVRSIELVSINGFDSSYRIIYYDKPLLNNIEYNNKLTGNDVKEYIPEYINVPLQNITINVRRS